MGGNIFLAGAKPSALERDPLMVQSNAQIRLQKRKDGHYLNVAFDPAWMAARQRPLVTTALLGVAALPDLPFVQANGTDLRVDTDFFGRPRDPANPAPGPFERPGAGELRLR
jgi:alpha-N-arabinofuranosidase